MPQARVELHTLSASPRGTYAPGVYRVGDQVPAEVAAAWLNAGVADLVEGEVRSAVPEEPERDATPTEPSEPNIEVEQSGSWYTIYVDGEEVEKVQGQANLEEALEGFK